MKQIHFQEEEDMELLEDMHSSHLLDNADNIIVDKDEFDSQATKRQNNQNVSGTPGKMSALLNFPWGCSGLTQLLLVRL